MSDAPINPKLLPTLMPFSVDFANVFSNENNIDLEIGCGRPHFFFDRAKNFPQRNIIGVEYKYEFMHSAQKKIVRENIKNALALHGNAWLLVPMLLKDCSISAVFINFPDPWWKEKHKKRLLLNEIFLKHLTLKLKKDGVIVLQTDVAELFSFYEELLTNNNFYKENLTDMEIINFCQAKTHREKKCMESSMPIYRGIFKLK